MNAPDFSRQGAWTQLLPQALTLMDHLERVTTKPLWTFGGGTVLMLRINHRHSKDVDLFVPDPQYLGYVNPRLSDAAEGITTSYREDALFIKLYLPAGEIDIVVGQSLTEKPFDLVKHQGREIRVETCAEIIAKKMWHRGDHANARDLFDLCAVAHHEPEALDQVAPFMAKHGAAFLDRLKSSKASIEEKFASIEPVDFKQSFDQCVEQAYSLLRPILLKKKTVDYVLGMAKPGA